VGGKGAFSLSKRVARLEPRLLSDGDVMADFNTIVRGKKDA